MCFSGCDTLIFSTGIKVSIIYVLNVLPADKSLAIQNPETRDQQLKSVLMHCINDIKALCNCRDCLGNAIKYSDSAAVKCPYRDAQYSCDSTLQDREIRAVSYLNILVNCRPMLCALYLSCIVIPNYNYYSDEYGKRM